MAEENDSLVKQMNKMFDENKDNKNEELFFTFKGVLYPNRLCSAETFEALETFEARKDDMLVIAYPKCGEYLLVSFAKERGTLYSGFFFTFFQVYPPFCCLWDNLKFVYNILQ